MDLHSLFEKVNSKESFIEFVQALRDDKLDEETKPTEEYSAGANGWENGSIPSFLDAMQAFTEDSDQIKEEPNWQTFALIVWAGKFYE